MTTRLEKAFQEAAKLPTEQQNQIADWLLDEIQSEKRWDQLFEDSQDILVQLANDALKEHQNGQTQDLDPEKL